MSRKPTTHPGRAIAELVDDLVAGAEIAAASDANARLDRIRNVAASGISTGDSLGASSWREALERIAKLAEPGE